MMGRTFRTFATGIVLATTASFGQAATLPSVVDGGETSVLFGRASLAALGFVVTGVGGGTSAPGSLGPNSVAFSVSGPGSVPASTLTYDPEDFLGSFSGTIEHMGSLSLTDTASGTDVVTIGDFTIGFDGARASGTASGFFVKDNLDTGEILFDLGSPLVEAFETELVITGNLLVSPELASILSMPSAMGSDAGLALVVAEASPVPLPAAAWLLGPAFAGLVWSRRRAAA